MTRVCVVGSINLDQSFYVHALPQPGETVLASALSSTPGGKGGNQAVAASRAGASVQLVATLGDDPAASQLRAHLHGNDVGLEGTVTVPGPSGAAVIVVDAGAKNTIVVAPGANAHLSMSSARARQAVIDAEVVLMQLEIPLDAVLAVARLGREAGALVIVNASPSGANPAGLAALAQVVDVVIVNEIEANEWHWPVAHLVITLGSAGARHRAGESTVEVPTPSVEPVDTTGAGDVFAGVLAAEWLSGPEVALRRACAAGALATLTSGAGDCAPYAKAIDDVLD